LFGAAPIRAIHDSSTLLRVQFGDELLSYPVPFLSNVPLKLHLLGFQLRDNLVQLVECVLGGGVQQRLVPIAERDWSACSNGTSSDVPCERRLRR
jgi:hypothetical protein